MEERKICMHDKENETILFRFIQTHHEKKKIIETKSETYNFIFLILEHNFKI